MNRRGFLAALGLAPVAAVVPENRFHADGPAPSLARHLVRSEITIDTRGADMAAARRWELEIERQIRNRRTRNARA